MSTCLHVYTSTYIYIHTHIYTHVYIIHTHACIHIYVYTHIHILEVGGVIPTGKSFRFVRACERAGEARRNCVAARSDVIRLMSALGYLSLCAWVSYAPLPSPRRSLTPGRGSLTPGPLGPWSITHGALVSCLCPWSH